MVCKKCNSYIAKGSLYCSNCGAKITEETSIVVGGVTNKESILEPQIFEDISTKSKLRKGIAIGVAIGIIVLFTTVVLINTPQAQAKRILLQKSKDNFITATDYFNKKDYCNSYKNFALVDKLDTKDYKIAVEKMKECIKLNTEKTLSDLPNYDKDESYSMALTSIKSALELDKDNKQLKDASAKYEKLNDDKRIKKHDEEFEADKERYKDVDHSLKAVLEASAKEAERASVYNKSNITPSIGMTKQEVLNSSWGSPEKINKTTTAYGVSEQWCYSNYKYIYFKNEIVTAIQE